MSLISPAVTGRRVSLDDASAAEAQQHIGYEVSSMDASEQSNSNLLQRIASGESDAVDLCLQRYGNLIWSLAMKYCRVKADAEDAVQEIFVEIWKSADRFDEGKASETAFVAMIARRRLIDRVRRQRTDAELVSLESCDFEMADQSIGNSAEISDEAAKAARCLQKLPVKQRNVLSLAIDQGEAHSSIANTLNIPLGTVKSYARRGLLLLRDCMKRPLIAEEAS